MSEFQSGKIPPTRKRYTEQVPEIKPFEAAAGKAIRDPVEPPYERYRKGTVPEHRDVAALDVLAAVGNVTGTTNVFRVKEPTMICVDGINPNFANNYDFGGMTLWMQLDTADSNEMLRVPSIGPYFWLPHAGVYFMRGYILTNGLQGGIISNAAKFFITLWRGVDPLVAAAMIQGLRPGWSHGVTRAIGAAATTAFQPPQGSGIKLPPATLYDAFGMHFHAFRCVMSNPGANPATVGVNNTALNATAGIPLASGGSITLDLPPGNTIYVFSTAGTNIHGLFHYI